MAAATAVLGLVLGAAPAATAAASAATAPPPVHRIVIYKGDDKPAVGPAGPLSTTEWTTDTAPENIYTNDGTLVEDTALTYPGVTEGGTWWYSAQNGGAVELHAFYWEKNGIKLPATQLTNQPNNNKAWFYLGNDTYSPRCLQFLAPSGKVVSFEMSGDGLSPGKWIENDTNPCTTPVPSGEAYEGKAAP